MTFAGTTTDSSLMTQVDHLVFEETDPRSVTEKAQAAMAMAREKKPRGAVAFILCTELTRNAGAALTDFWFSKVMVRYLRAGWERDEAFPHAVKLNHRRIDR